MAEENFFDTLTNEKAEEILRLNNLPEVKEAMGATENFFDALDKSSKKNAGEAFLISTGKGFVNAAQGIENLFELVTGDNKNDVAAFFGLPDKQSQEQAFAPLKEEFPVTTFAGETLGEVAGTLPFGGAAASGAKAATRTAAPLVARFAPVAAAGATEGAIIGADQDAAGFGAVVGTGGAVAAEALLPPVARRLKRFFGKAKPLGELVEVVDGSIKPTKETLDVLDEVGVKFDDIAADAQKELLNPQQAAVKGAFMAEGIEPASRTRIRPNVADIQREGYLLRQTGDDGAADAFRERVVNENEAIKNRFSQIADQLGVGGEEGAAKLKNALFDIKSSMRSARNRAYQDLAEVAKSNPKIVNKIPLNEERIFNSVAEADNFGLDDSTEKALVKAFEDFGLVERSGKRGGLAAILGEGDIQKLNISNLHDFRKRINNVFDQTKPKEVLARKQIIDAIDDVESEIVDAFDGADFDAPKVIQQAAKRARQTVIDEKKVFNERDLIEQLVSPRQAGLNAKEAPLVASSKVFGKVATKSTPVENVRKLVDTLLKDGSEDSLEALGNLQASTMLDLLDASVQPSKKLVNKSGTTVDVFSGSRLEKQIKNIGEDKIKAIFKNNPEALASLARLRKIASATITPDEAVQKGSLPPGVLNSAFESISRAKGVPVVGAVGDVSTKIQTSRASKKVTSFKPSEDDLIDYILLENNPRITKMLQTVGKYTPARSAAAVSSARESTEKPPQQQLPQDLID